MNKKWLVYAGIFVAGVILANRVRAIGPLSKLPSL
jgi:hypothetical protein